MWSFPAEEMLRHEALTSVFRVHRCAWSAVDTALSARALLHVTALHGQIEERTCTIQQQLAEIVSRSRRANDNHTHARRTHPRTHAHAHLCSNSSNRSSSPARAAECQRPAAFAQERLRAEFVPLREQLEASAAESAQWQSKTAEAIALTEALPHPSSDCSQFRSTSTSVPQGRAGRIRMGR